MQRRTVIIRGKVQRVGLRVQVWDIAKKLGVCGTVENLSTGSVLVVCEAERQVLDEMMRQIKQIPEPVVIDDMVVKTSPATGMSGFRVLTHDSDEEWKVAIKTGMGLLGKISETLVSIDKSQTSMNQTLVSIDKSQTSMNQTLVSIDKTLDSIDKSQTSMNQTLVSIDKSQTSMNQTLVSIRDTQEEMRDTLVSMNGKMDMSLNNDAQILDILREMRSGGMLRIPK